MTTTPTGIPIELCPTCNRTHPITRRHCVTCNRATVFIFTPAGMCTACMPVVIEEPK